MTSTTDSWTWKEYLVGTSIAIGIATASYLVYFDHKRRSDPHFRKTLKKQRKAAMKLKAEEEAARAKSRAAASSDAGADAADKIPTNIEEKEKFFMDQLQSGEILYRKGPAHFQAAAACFMRAMKVYPQPLELIGLFQRTLPEPVFQLVMEMMAAEIKKKQEDYYQHFPVSSMNTKAKETVHGQTSDGRTMVRRGLMVTKSFKAGEVIYREKPLVTQMNALSQNYCDYCLTSLTNLGPDDVTSCDHCHTTTYCSSECRQSAWSEYHKYLCPPADSALVKHSFEESKSKIPLMVLKFVGRVVKEDQENQNAVADDNQYSNWDHIERMLHIELGNGDKKEEEKELGLILGTFEGKIPSIDTFLTLDRYTMLKGKFMYNIIGIPTAFPSHTNATTDNHRSATSPSSHIGAALYHITSYISHSCDPNTSIRFINESSEVELVADSDLNEGDEIFMSWIEGGEKDGRSRREELHKKYKFRCQCTKCSAQP